MVPSEQPNEDQIGGNSGVGEVGRAGAVKETETTTPDEEDDEQAPEYSKKVLDYLREAKDETEASESSIPGFGNYRNIPHPTGGDEDADQSSTPVRPLSPGNSSSIQDETPSVQDSLGSSATNARPKLPFGFSHSLALKPFDRRFSSSLLSPASNDSSSRPSSPGFPGLFSPDHSRTSSVSGSVLGQASPKDSENAEGQLPWEVVRWTKLKKITIQSFSEQARRNLGIPTCIAISATIAIGTSKGLVLIFDYGQNLKSVVGIGTKAVESGPVTALAVSQDHTTIASGHADGTIYTWELARPAKPFLTIPSLPLQKLELRKQDGHTEGLAVLHIGFLGTRHTALASADEKGMAFSHLATRGLGAVGRTVKTTRLLGRYPFDVGMSVKPRRPSSILGFAPLPLGNIVQATDSMGLIAMLTPYILVIVSTTPIAQTQFKANRPKEVSRQMPLSGCLSWFPAVKLKTTGSYGQPAVSKPRLVYCWSNLLTLMELVTVEDEVDPNRPPSLRFRTCARWECEESIVAVQWISRQIICVLTISQRLIILEDPNLEIAETFDLMAKHIVRHSTFKNTLLPLTQPGESSSSFTSIADAYYNSFKTYKGRVFLLCAGELTIGTLSNWKDRLLALMEVGDYIAAIQLATSYYIGSDNRITIGLPDDPTLRHPLVGDKIIELLKASLRFLFGKVDRGEEPATKKQAQELAEVCFFACLSIGRIDFIFDEAFENFEEGAAVGTFLETMEKHILDGKIKMLPPTVVKALVIHYTNSGWEERLEDIICRLETTSLDIDQVTSLCSKHRLYDAMAYVWNQALNDYITPLIQLLQLLTPILSSNTDIDAANATKIFPYLAYTLTGRVYPSGELMSEDQASAAKASIYYFFFVGRAIRWPLQAGKLFLTTGAATTEPSFPYLRLVLHFDGPSLLSALNEAFEDSFLNGFADQVPSAPKSELPEDQVFGRSVNRQYIVSILLEVINDETLPPMDRIYLNMFIARNLPKFPQYLLLTGSSLHSILVGLCNNTALEIAEDCQLSVEYLLSVYRPPDMDELVTLCEGAGFFRVLKTVFRQEKKYAKLIQTYFKDDEDRMGVFGCIGTCLDEAAQTSERSRKEVLGVLESFARELVALDVVKTAETVESHAAFLHGKFLSAIEDRQYDQYCYLRALLEPQLTPTAVAATLGRDATRRSEAMKNADFVELYIRLMCKFQQDHVSEFAGSVRSGDIRLENVLPTMEESGIVDAAVLLMARDGQIQKAMDRLVGHLATLGGLLSGLLEGGVEERENENTLVEDTLNALKKYVQVGVWLCRGQSRRAGSGSKGMQKMSLKLLKSAPKLSDEELLWLDLIEAVVRISKIGIHLSESSKAISAPGEVTSRLVTSSLRSLVQITFAPLLADPALTPFFLPILRAFLIRASADSPTLSSLRSVLSSIFSAYTYESSLLSLTQTLLDHALFENIATLTERRQKGWKPSSQMCEGCFERVWGPGVGNGVFEQWDRRRKKKEKELVRRRSVVGVSVEEERSLSRGKMKAPVAEIDDDDDEEETQDGTGDDISRQQGNMAGRKGGKGPIVVFVCTHVYHRNCLESLSGAEANEHGGPDDGEWLKCLACVPAS
ncbi:hypothetical protein BJ508DRAFT_411060 [Ascobolus immersus RN42]|uniref:Uncharacterized protein n=1 Tax=Ascobolus immersus RN42 TaxID=1160509 RepID=A0A3N4IZ29_ASCIM|nr:hypothetical protein BJ508DRAFT_411060 [Ascobolus immersus RN42]